MEGRISRERAEGGNVRGCAARARELVDTGFTPPRPWLFRAVCTDDGLTGYSEFGSDGITRGLVRDLAGRLVGKDPISVDRHYVDIYRAARHAAYGAAQMAIAGIDLARWDLAGKALGVPVWRLEIMQSDPDALPLKTARAHAWSG